MYITQNIKRDLGQIKLRGPSDLDEVIKQLSFNKPVCVYVKIDYINIFFEQLKNISGDAPLVLVTGNSDYSFTQEMLIKALNIPRIKRIYAQNVEIFHPLIRAMPIGIIDEDIDVFSKTSGNDKLYYKLKSNFKKSKKMNMYLNFSINTNLFERKGLYEKFKNFSWVKTDFPNLSLDDYVNNLTDCAYCISPPGNGIDCHRTWECIYSGVVPIIKNSTAMSYFLELPILYVNDFSQININFLEKSYTKFEKIIKTNVYDNYSIDFYKQMIRNDLCMTI